MISIENQVCGIVHSIIIYNSEIRVPSTFYWLDFKLITRGQFELLDQIDKNRAFSAYTISELGNFLPYKLDGYSFEVIKNKIDWIAQYRLDNRTIYPCESRNLKDVIAKVVIYLANDRRIDSKKLAA